MSSSSDVFVAAPRPIRTVVVPTPEPVTESLPAGVTALPYRTRVDYRADDDAAPALPPHGAPADHVTTQPPRSRDVARLASSQHAINAVSYTHLTLPTILRV